MKSIHTVVACLLFTSWQLHAADSPFVAIDVTTAEADPDFAIQGEYITPENATSAKGMQVVALGNGLFRVVIYEGGLPGAGWNRQPPQVLNEEETSAVRELIAAIGFGKTQRQSPTLGAEPPAGAIVLFDGTAESFKKQWKEGAKLSQDGLLEQGATSVETFQDFIAHIEFMTPYMPHARGQGRGNSGIYYQGRYETQVLDSFGLAGKNNETGGIYEIRDPDLNMCFPPLVWQTYDIEFTAPRWDAAGKKTANARLTVRLNGIVVQRDVDVPRTTRAAPLQESPEAGPLYIQNHGNPVRFRNIWVVPRDADREARRPRIPSFERFPDLGGPAGSGSLLVGELGCVNCHQADPKRESFLASKQAPILTNVGKRVRPDWMMQFIADPHRAKPGTTMPNLFSGWEPSKRNAAVLALTNFLTSTGRVAEQSPNLQAANQGRRLFHEIGCVACHAPLEGATVSTATSVPLANLPEKYSVPSLTEFLKSPHAVRPSGRMPSLNLDNNEAEQLAQYLAAGGQSLLAPNMQYSVYHGSWQSLPSFDELQPISSGTSAGFDLSVAGKKDDFAVQFAGFYLATKTGPYQFWLGSDDGSALWIDGKRVVDVDGIHPHSVKEVTVELTEGVHSLRIDYFELGGEESLTLDVQPPAAPRQDASALLTLNEDGSPVENPRNELISENPLAFRSDPGLIETGRALFVSLGCVNCHEMKSGNETMKGTSATEFAQLNTGRGCLSEEQQPANVSSANIPDFELSPQQIAAISSVISQEAPKEADSPTVIQQTMARFNCYACHERGGIGGPEFDRNPLFLTSQHEMGDEGRVPPPLNGVGDKLNDSWLNHVLANGANDRPYMQTRMPKFGSDNLAHLAKAFIEVDRVDEAELATFADPLHRVKAIGRELVGDQALACVKCHTFGPHRATGIQALSLTDMTKRIREDWFLRYLYEPARYRPGTRMPTGFPNGQAAIREIYDGDPGKQISAVWTYLQDGTKAGIPNGLLAQMIELKPEQEPIIYRNFIEGTSPRGIAVGYPEKAHLAWDANDLCLKLIWHNRFIDASKHWVGRGPGNQVPLGDHQLRVEPTIPLAVLAAPDAAWPADSPRQRDGFEFRGYRLNSQGQPAFMYETPFAVVTDFPKPVAGIDSDASFERTLEITPTAGAGQIYFRAAIAKEIEPLDDGYRIDQAMTIFLEGGGKPFLRTSNGQSELLVPLPAESVNIQIIQRIKW